MKHYQDYLNASNPRVTIFIEGKSPMVVELFPEVAKNTVANFVDLVKKGYYTEVIFHRVIEGFMIQGGQGKAGAKAIKGDFIANGVNNELAHARGVISMARTSVMNSASSQFFIMHKDAPHLDRQYAAFGVLVEGFDTLDAIASSRTDRMDRPLEDVIITRMELTDNGFESTVEYV